MNEKVLVLNGSFCEIPIIQEAKKLGYYVITTGNMPELVGHKYADEYIKADYSDKEQILKLVKEKNINQILSCANDFGVLTAAYVAEKMGWSGHDPYKTAELLHHKDKFKKYTYEHQIPSPHSVAFTNQTEAKKYVQNTEYPIIVKAADLTGGKGICKAENFEEALKAIENAFERSRDKHIVIEPYITGTQHTLVTFLCNKKIVSSASCNCYSLINPYLIQAETFPADDSDEMKKILFPIIEDMAIDLNLADGIIALQYIKKNGTPYIIETMRRPFGNQFLVLVELVSGYPWHKAQILAETGNDCSNLESGSPKKQFCGHFGIMSSQNGRLRDYYIPDKIQNHVFNKIDMLKPGGTIKDYLNERISYIYYEYDNKEDMNSDVKQYNEWIQIDME
ncbi:ATP-grasp domain-containing protein [Mediterraneibacter agrestimuris]|uniref:ATP-grasp domain-containing protein n=1 Tax=Mediterraneibacter agrestimuris TaxID=2941333 RepID=UPI00203F8A68|nr:ATP-grasp domain-containing protein [Mediterraneibacter agrestimuris]